MTATVEPLVPEAASHRPAHRAAWDALVRGASLRVLLALALIWALFTLLNGNFLGATNLTNLTLQVAAVSLVSVGVVFVLLLGEVDLSVGSVSGFTAAVMAVLNVRHGLPGGLAMLVAILLGAAIGVFQGGVISRFGVPSFIATLAGLLAWQGMQLIVLGDQGAVNLPNGPIVLLTDTFLAPWLGWLLAIAGVVAFAASGVLTDRRRRVTGLRTRPHWQLAGQAAALALVAIGAVVVFDADQGVPLAVVIVLAVLLVADLVLKRTGVGRSVMAVGGNPEAARRAGIPVRRVRLGVFALGSAMAAVGGIMAASRLLAVSGQSGGGEFLLYAIAGPVIAGTSLFGGRGSVWSALLGALVIGSIANGLDLLSLDASIKYVVTGGVLLAAVTVDAMTNQRRETGRR